MPKRDGKTALSRAPRLSDEAREMKERLRDKHGVDLIRMLKEARTELYLAGESSTLEDGIRKLARETRL